MRLLAILLFFLPLNALSQGDGNGYRPPLESTLRLAGNFGELRRNHFHTGLDFKTWGRTGLKIKAIQKGEVSRIKIQEGGYGKVLYIDHPDGNTSVYAHLRSFAAPIRKFLRKVQYKHERGPIDLYPGEGILEVEKGETIGYSGNSGSSTAPHLHFEIRNTRSEKPIDPLLFKLFDLEIFDHRAPEFKGVRISWPNKKEARTAETIPARSAGHRAYTLSSRNPIQLGKGGPVGFEVRAVDRSTGTHNPLGVQRIELFVNDSSWFRIAFDTLDFSKKHHFNAHIDHPYYYRHRRRYHRCHLLPNNRLPIYGNHPKKGWLYPKEDSLYRIRIEAMDREGNRSVLRFKARAGEKTHRRDSSENVRIPWDRKTSFEREGIRLSFPRKALFQDLHLQYEKKEKEGSRISDSYQVHTAATPLAKPFEARIRVDSLPPKSKDRLFIVSEDRRWGKKYYKADYQKGWAEGKVDRFGELKVEIDSTPPGIQPLRIQNQIPQGKEEHFRFRVRDDRSGIASYQAFLGDRWCIPFYDKKTGQIHVRVSDPERPLPEGKKKFRLKVTDRAGNERSFLKSVKLKGP